MFICTMLEGMQTTLTSHVLLTFYYKKYFNSLTNILHCYGGVVYVYANLRYFVVTPSHISLRSGISITSLLATWAQ